MDILSGKILLGCVKRISIDPSGNHTLGLVPKSDSSIWLNLCKSIFAVVIWSFTSSR